MKNDVRDWAIAERKHKISIYKENISWDKASKGFIAEEFMKLIEIYKTHHKKNIEIPPNKASKITREDEKVSSPSTNDKKYLETSTVPAIYVIIIENIVVKWWFFIHMSMWCYYISNFGSDYSFHLSSDFTSMILYLFITSSEFTSIFMFLLHGRWDGFKVKLIL